MTKRLLVRGIFMLAILAGGFVGGVALGAMPADYEFISNIHTLWKNFESGLLSALLIVSWMMFAVAGFAIGGCICYVVCADIVESAIAEAETMRRLAREVRGILQPEHD